MMAPFLSRTKSTQQTSRVPVTQGSLANFLSPAQGGLACSRLASRRCPACEVTQKRYVHGTKSECPSLAAMVAEVQPKRRYARMKVLIGVDPHKASVAVAAVDEAKGELLERASFPQDRSGLRSLERWARRFPERRWAVENAGGLGRHLAVRLAAAGEPVVDVPPKLSARVRVLSTFAGNARKNDGLDALAIALAASRNERLADVDPETASEAMRLLSERRDDLVAERTRALNRLHGLLRDLVPGGVTGKLSADRAARILRGIRPRGASSRVRRRLASEILLDVRTLDRKIADLNERIEAEVEASGTALTQIFGVGPILAATIIGAVGSVARFPSKGHASYSGTAP